MKMRYYSIVALMVAAGLVAFAVAYPHLPARVPTHWNARGEVDAYGSAWSLLAMGPGLMAMLAALFAALLWLSPKRFAIEAFERTYLSLMLIVVSIPGYLFAVMLWSFVTGETHVLKAFLVGVCLFTLLIGNLLGKVRRNFFVGIRTPWTLASERNWYATHRFAGKAIVSTSALAALLVLLGAPVLVTMGLVMAGFVAPVIYSMLYFKRMERLGDGDSPA